MTGERTRSIISQGDYLALVSQTAVKTRELTDAEALTTQKSTVYTPPERADDGTGPLPY